MAVTVTLSCSGGAWTASVDDGGTVTAVPLSVSGGSLVGTVGDVVVSVANPCPTPAVPTTYATTRDCCGCNYAIFSVGDPAVCTDAEGAGGPCANVARIKVEYACCARAGWAGPGWYCVRAAGTEDACEPAELLDGDECDAAIDVCGGPYADEAAAAFSCGDPPDPGTSCADAPDVPLGAEVVRAAVEVREYWHLALPAGAYRATWYSSAVNTLSIDALPNADCTGSFIGLLSAGNSPSCDSAGERCCHPFTVPDGYDCVCVYIGGTPGNPRDYAFKIESGGC